MCLTLNQYQGGDLVTNLRVIYCHDVSSVKNVPVWTDSTWNLNIVVISGNRLGKDLKKKRWREPVGKKTESLEAVVGDEKLVFNLWPVLWPPQTVLQMDEHGSHSRTNVTTLSTEHRIKSKATRLSGREASAWGLVTQITKLNLGSCFQLCTRPGPAFFFFIIFFTELLSVQSAEENDFVLNYSPMVWKGVMNVWLGMNFDTDSKYKHVTGRHD